jgi:CBS domain containing-hemolysin-like protein
MGIVWSSPLAAGPPLGSFELSAPAGLLLAALLVFLNGFFVAAEFALVKVRPTQVDEHQHTQRGRTTRHMIDHLDAYLSATQLGITLASLGLGWIGEPAVARLLQPVFAWLGLADDTVHTVSLVIGFTLISVLHIILGELAPKSIAIRKPVPTSLWISLPLFLFYKISFPAIYLLNAGANSLLRMVGIAPVTGHDLAHNEEELRRLLASTQDSRLPEDKRELLDNIFELSHRVARQVMVPRGDVVYLDLHLTVEENLAIARESGHTRFPLCEGDLDTTTGLVHIKDLFRAGASPKDLRDVQRPIFFVPETLPLERLLRRMRGEHQHMAAILDEYGSVAGIVTLENVIEEIVGEIQDEFDAERPSLTKVSDNVYQVAGSILLEDLEAELELEISERDEDTIAGVVLSELGRRARVGDRVTVGPVDLEVLETSANRINTVRLTVREPVSPEAVLASNGGEK